jgi:hypothetical protein
MDASGRPNHIEDILVRLHRGQWFGFNGDRVYANLEIYPVDGVTHNKPKEAALTKDLIQEQAAWDAADYRRNRAIEYPSIGDQLDMQYHDSLDGTTTWADAIAAVKTKYPKPS